MDDKEYKEEWKNLGSIEIRMIQKDGKCIHQLDDIFYYKSPYSRPEKVCSALLHVLELYTWRVALGFPSWENDSRDFPL